MNRRSSGESRLKTGPSSQWRASGRVRRLQGPRPSADRHHVVTDRKLVAATRKANGGAKRAADIVIASLALLLLAPALLTILPLLAIEQRAWPVLGEWVVGRRGVRFRAWSLRAWLSLEETPDIRNAPLARWIGAYGFDRTLMLWNVLCGEMSLVGPRPIPRTDLDRYQDERRYYLLLRPGFTGPWRLTDAADVAFRATLDREYLEAWSLKRDALILCRTVPLLFGATAAR